TARRAVPGRSSSRPQGPGPVVLSCKGTIVKKQFLVPAFKYGIGLTLLVWVIWKNWGPSPDGTSMGLSGALQRPIHFLPLLLGVLICFASVLLTFVRWFLLVRAQGLPFTSPAALRLGLMGYFFNNFLPSSVGGDILKAAGIARVQSRRTVAVATVLIDRIIGLCGLFWLVTLLGGF